VLPGPQVRTVAAYHDNVSEGSLPARVVRHLGWRARRLRTATADRLRRGDRTITMTPPVGPRLGNWLYLWLHAHAESREGNPWRVLETPGMREWFAPFRGLQALTIDRGQLRFHDRRVWDDVARNQRFGEQFSRAQLNDFVREVLAPGIPAATDDDVIVNVRRGDYYAQAELRERYGFDQIGYLTDALQRVERSERIRVVSDDPQWCRDNLEGLLLDHTDQVVYEPPGAVANFLAVSSHRTLIGTNSTFSYWGGYIAGALHEDARVIMPRFHARLETGTDAWQLDPAWTIIDGHH